MTAALVILILVLAVIGSTVALIVRGIAAGKNSEAETIRIRGARHSLGPVTDLEIRPLTDGDRRDWEKLWHSYCEFYGEAVPASTTETTWTRLMDGSFPMWGYGAFGPDGTMLGLAHTVLHPHTWSPKTLCYLEDLFVVQAVRGREVGFALISFLWKLAEGQGWGRLYWHTEATNTAARRLYDRFRPADGYVRYTLTL